MKFTFLSTWTHNIFKSFQIYFPATELTFTNSKDTPVLIKAISKEFKGKAVFGEARSTDAALIAKYQVNQFPSLYQVTPTSYEKFTQNFGRSEIEKWIFQHMDNHQIVIFSRELSRSLFQAGNCNAADSRYCLLSFDPDSELKSLLNELSAEFKDDPIQVFWVNSSKYPTFAAEFQGKNVIYRGKRQKYFTIECDKEYECFRSKIVSALSGGGDYKQITGTLNFTEKKPEL